MTRPSAGNSSNAANNAEAAQNQTAEDIAAQAAAAQSLGLDNPAPEEPIPAQEKPQEAQANIPNPISPPPPMAEEMAPPISEPIAPPTQPLPEETAMPAPEEMVQTEAVTSEMTAPLPEEQPKEQIEPEMASQPEPEEELEKEPEVKKATITDYSEKANPMGKIKNLVAFIVLLVAAAATGYLGLDFAKWSYGQSHAGDLYNGSGAAVKNIFINLGIYLTPIGIAACSILSLILAVKSIKQVFSKEI